MSDTRSTVTDRYVWVMFVLCGQTCFWSDPTIYLSGHLLCLLWNLWIMNCVGQHWAFVGCSLVFICVRCRFTVIKSVSWPVFCKSMNAWEFASKCYLGLPMCSINTITDMLHLPCWHCFLTPFVFWPISTAVNIQVKPIKPWCTAFIALIALEKRSIYCSLQFSECQLFWHSLLLWHYGKVSTGWRLLYLLYFCIFRHITHLRYCCLDTI